jgi:hypothetical protein
MMEMLDLTKWNLQTIESVKHVLAKANAACVGHCLLFQEPIDEINSIWKFKTHLAFDPNNPPPEEDRKRLEEIFERWAELAQLIMSGGKKHD